VAQYNKTLKLAYVPLDESEMDMGAAAREDDFIDRYGHLSEEEIKALTKESVDPAQYDFENGQSVTTINRRKKKGPQKAKEASIGPSRYSLRSTTSVDEVDEDDIIDDLGSTKVTFAMLASDGTETNRLVLPDKEVAIDLNDNSSDEFSTVEDPIQ
jgi:hypothetical protein